MYPELSSQENIKYLNSPKSPPDPRQKFQFDKSLIRQESKKFKIKYYTSEKTDEKLIEKPPKATIKQKTLKQQPKQKVVIIKNDKNVINKPRVKVSQNDNIKPSVGEVPSEEDKIMILNKTIQNQFDHFDQNIYRPQQNQQQQYQQQQKNQQQYQQNSQYQFESNSIETINYDEEANEEGDEEAEEIVRTQNDQFINETNDETNNSNNDDEENINFLTKKDFERSKNEQIKKIRKRITYLKSQKNQNYQEIYKHQQIYLKILNEQYNYKPPDAVNRKSKSINNLNDATKSNGNYKKPYFVF